MLHLFHMDVAEVDRGMLHMLQLSQRHVASVCFECFRSMFHLCFPNACCECVYLDVPYVSHICCMYFYLDVAYGYNSFKCF
jgi:hypothetical protein